LKKKEDCRHWHQLQTPESKRLHNTATHRNSTTPQQQQKLLHPNIPARSYTNRIHRLFSVEGNQGNKKGQETFSAT
jgi:hypothetical protein